MKHLIRNQVMIHEYSQDQPARYMSVSSMRISILKDLFGEFSTGLLIAVAPRYRYCSGATFIVAVAVAPLLLTESSGESSAATF